MTTNRFRRHVALLERGAPWFAASTGLTLLLALLLWLGQTGRLDGILGQGGSNRHLRGYTPIGLFFGIATVLLAILAVTYSLRKRPLQERLAAGGGTMTMWLWLHVAAGGVGLVAAFLHAGTGLWSGGLTTGKVLAVIFGLLTLSGVAWRVVYHVIPKIAAPKIGNYSTRDSELRADEQWTEIEKLAAGRSAELHKQKEWIVEHAPSDEEIASAASKLSPEERKLLLEIRALAESRRRAIEKQRQKLHYTRWLQSLRLAHVPLTLLLLPVLLIHVVGSLDLPVRSLRVGEAPSQLLSGLRPSRDCRNCHRDIYEQWASSMHARALKSPMTVAQNNQLLAEELWKQPSPDPRQLCINCHGPIGAAISSRARLPLARSGYDAALINEGVDCATCHQYTGGSSPGSAGLSGFQRAIRPGVTYLGEIEDPAGNPFHRSGTSEVMKRDGSLCANCHDVQYDVNADGKIQKGIDLVLQTTQEEYDDYVAQGGKGTCVSCHMPILAGQTRAAERAILGSEQDGEAPPREVHDHSFVGVDYPLDEVATNDPQRAAREALLRSAALLDVTVTPAPKKGDLQFAVAITNAGVGHNLPSGFAFARQMWLEVRVSEDARPTFESGVLAKASDDLCDAGTLADPINPARVFMTPCRAVDTQLVNFQQKLLDHIDVERDTGGNPVLDAKNETHAIPAAGATETWLQHMTAGPVPRVRPSDKVVLGPIAPSETRTFVYRVPTSGKGRATVAVRLLFRSLPPYMVKALGYGQQSEPPALTPLVENLQIVEMAAKSIVVELTSK